MVLSIPSFQLSDPAFSEDPNLSADKIQLILFPSKLDPPFEFIISVIIIQ